MIADLRVFLLLLWPKIRGLVRLARARESRHPLRLLFFTALGLAFALLIYLGSAWFLRQCLQVELVGALIPRKLMSLVLLILVSILLISATISSFSILYLSEDLALLFAAPVSPGPLYHARFAEMVLHASWMVAFFGLPVFLAYGTAYQAPAAYYLQLALLFPALLLIPAALGAMVAAVLTRLFSARRSRDLLIVLVLCGFVFLFLVLRALRPEQLLDEESFGTLAQFLQMFSTPESRFLPGRWMTDALFPLLSGRQDPLLLPTLLLWSTAGALLAAGSWIGTALYRRAYALAQQGRLRWSQGRQERAGAGRVLGGWMDRGGSLLGRLTGSLLVKDLRVFMRDTNQWLQLLLLGALAAVYLLNFVYLRVANLSWFALYTVNHALLGLVVSGVAVRFVFPAVSLEGRAFWIIRAAPVDPGDFLHSKLLIHFVPLTGLGIFLVVLSCAVIGVPLAFMVVSVGLMLILVLGVCALGVGIGALHPRFEVENPAKIPTSVGGVIYMITSMGFVLAFLLSSFYPTFVLFRLAENHPLPAGRPGWLVASLLVLAALGIGAAWLPMFLGRRKLQRMER